VPSAFIVQMVSSELVHVPASAAGASAYECDQRAREKNLKKGLFFRDGHPAWQ
jgi:hypothetical protein